MHKNWYLRDHSFNETFILSIHLQGFCGFGKLEDQATGQKIV